MCRYKVNAMGRTRHITWEEEMEDINEEVYYISIN